MFIPFSHPNAAEHPEQRGMGGQVEIRNNIKILISNDQNISGTYTIFTGD